MKQQKRPQKPRSKMAWNSMRPVRKLAQPIVAWRMHQALARARKSRTSQQRKRAQQCREFWTSSTRWKPQAKSSTVACRNSTRVLCALGNWLQCKVGKLIMDCDWKIVQCNIMKLPRVQEWDFGWGLWFGHFSLSKIGKLVTEIYHSVAFVLWRWQLNCFVHSFPCFHAK